MGVAWWFESGHGAHPNSQANGAYSALMSPPKWVSKWKRISSTQWFEGVESVPIRLIEASWRCQSCLRDQTSVFFN